MSTWSMILTAALLLLVIFWFRPGIKEALERSQQAQKDWTAVLIPIALVILFIIVLVMMV